MPPESLPRCVKSSQAHQRQPSVDRWIGRKVCKGQLGAIHGAPHHRPAGRFLKTLPRVLFWGPRVVKIGFLAKRYSDFTYFHNFSTDFWKSVENYENLWNRNSFSRGIRFWPPQGPKIGPGANFLKIGWLADDAGRHCLIVWMFDWLIDWLIDWMIDWLVVWMIVELIEWFIDQLVELLTASLIEWPCLIDWLIAWLID